MVGGARIEALPEVGYSGLDGSGLSAGVTGTDPTTANGTRIGLEPMEINLIMFREDGAKRVFPLSQGETTIGRKDDCNIRIPLAVVSRHHAVIQVEEDGAVLKDLGASNGTYLNNHKVTEDDLEPGDQIMIGPVVLTVQMDGEPSDDEIVEIRTKIPVHGKAKQGGAAVSTSNHVYATDDEIDPISALEELASSADQTAINPEGDD